MTASTPSIRHLVGERRSQILETSFSKDPLRFWRFLGTLEFSGYDEKANKAIRTPKDQWYQVSPAWRNVTSAPGAEEIQWSAFDQKYEGKCFQYNEVPSLATPLLKHEVGEIIRVGPATGQTCGDQVVWAQMKEYV